MRKTPAAFSAAVFVRYVSSEPITRFRITLCPLGIVTRHLISVGELKEVEAGVGRVVAVQIGGGVIQKISSLRSLGDADAGTVATASAVSRGECANR